MDYEDFDQDIELDGALLDDDAEWDEETLELEWDESEAQSVMRELGVTSAL
jgi:hypothetical protein